MTAAARFGVALRDRGHVGVPRSFFLGSMNGSCGSSVELSAGIVIENEPYRSRVMYF